MALYAPGMGYYSGGAHKFGAAGDFVTAPEISAAFSQTLGAQVAQILALSAPQIVEVGAGSGRVAADLLLELELRDSLPERYAILDLSGELRERQRETISHSAPHLLDRVDWLDRLPERFDGLVLANELLDAMPVLASPGATTRIARRCERGVVVRRSGKTAGRGALERAQLLSTKAIRPA
jgi:SAM-dependent MidA family methyltransferase